jgi:hypothetical protein
MQEKMTADVMSSRVDRFVCISSPEGVCADEVYAVFMMKKRYSCLFGLKSSELKNANPEFRLCLI